MRSLSPGLLPTIDNALVAARRIGFPLYLKQSFGWAGQGVTYCPDAETLTGAFPPHRGSIAKAYRHLIAPVSSRAQPAVAASPTDDRERHKSGANTCPSLADDRRAAQVGDKSAIPGEHFVGGSESDVYRSKGGGRSAVSSTSGRGRPASR